MTASANCLQGFYAQARRHPRRAAIIQGLGRSRRALSFGELAGRVPRLAQGLLELGLKKGDRVLIFVPMSLELYECVLACFHAGLSAVFVDAWAGRARLDAAVRLAAPRALLAIPKAGILRLLSPSMRAIPLQRLVSPQLFPVSRLFATSAAELEAVGAGDEALVTFTTGSTGAPKGAARSHGFLLAQGKALIAAFGKPAAGNDMPTLPAFVLLNLGQGVTSVLPDFDPRKPAEIKPGRILAQMKAESVVSSGGSPAFYERLADYGRIPLRRLYTGGAAVPPSLALKLQGACDGKVYVVYGSTEAEPIAHAGTQELIRASRQARPGLLPGKPKGLHLKIAQPFDGPLAKLKALARGQVGEICVAGAHVQKSYLNDSEAEARNKVHEGRLVWHRTGDAGYLDAQGRLFLMGRLQQRVLRQGKTWWSGEAERRVRELEGVSFAAYFGWQGKAWLCVELGRGTDAGLESQARQALGPMPMDAFRAFKRLPRDPRHASKIDLEALKLLLKAGA